MDKVSTNASKIFAISVYQLGSMQLNAFWNECWIHSVANLHYKSPPRLHQADVDLALQFFRNAEFAHLQQDNITQECNENSCTFTYRYPHTDHDHHITLTVKILTDHKLNKAEETLSYDRALDHKETNTKCSASLFLRFSICPTSSISTPARWRSSLSGCSYAIHQWKIQQKECLGWSYAKIMFIPASTCAWTKSLTCMHLPCVFRQISQQ